MKSIEDQAIEQFTNQTIYDITQPTETHQNYKTNINDNTQSKTNNYSQLNNTDHNNNKFELPLINKSAVNLSNNSYSNNETPIKDRPIDLFNKITQMKVVMEQEESSKKRMDLIVKKQQQKEELDRMIQSKKNYQQSVKREENQKWHNVDFNKVQEGIEKEAENKYIQKLKNENEKNTRFKILQEKYKDDEIKNKEEEF